MKNTYVRQVVAGLFGAAFIVGGLAALPYVFAEDDNPAGVTNEITEPSAPVLTLSSGDLAPPVLLSPEVPPAAQGTTPVVIPVAGVWDADAIYDTTADVTNGPSAGTASLDPDTGVLTYYPEAAFHGTATINYTATDQTGQQASGTVDILVLATPVAYDFLVWASFDTPVTIDVLGQSLLDAAGIYTVRIVQVINGSAIVIGEGLDQRVLFTPAPGWHGDDHINYAITDQAGQSPSMTMTVRVVTWPTLTANPASATVLPGQTVVFNNKFAVDTPYKVKQDSCLISPAVPGASVDNSGKVTYQATDLGIYDITLTCTDSVGQTTLPVTNTVVVVAAGLQLSATATRIAGDSDKPMAGDEITWTYEVTNSGDIAVSGLTVTGGTCDDAALGLGGTTTCRVISVLTQADIDAGVTKATAQASATANSYPAGQPVASNTVNPEMPLNRVAAVTANKTFSLNDANGNGAGDPGETVTFTITAQNTGNVTLHGVTVTDNWGALALTCDGDGVLDAAKTMTCTATYEVTIADQQAGDSLRNTAQATALDPAGTAVTSAFSQVNVPLYQPVAPILRDDTVDDPQPQGDAPVLVDVKANDTWDAYAIYTATVTVDGGSDTGTADLDVATGWLTFTPNASFHGLASIEYSITDQLGQSDRAMATLQVAAGLAAQSPGQDEADTGGHIVGTVPLVLLVLTLLGLGTWLALRTRRRMAAG